MPLKTWTEVLIIKSRSKSPFKICSDFFIFFFLDNKEFLTLFTLIYYYYLYILIEKIYMLSRSWPKTNFSEILQVDVDIVLSEVPWEEKCRPESIANPPFSRKKKHTRALTHFHVLFILRWMAQPISLRLGI